MGQLGTGRDSCPHITQWLKGKFALELADYVGFVEEAKEKGYPVKLGVEADYIPGCEEQIAAWLEDTPWDYVIGSVHFIGKWGFDHSPEGGWPQRDVDGAFRDYYALVARAAATGLFDIIGHFDLIKLFGHRPVAGRGVDTAVLHALRTIRTAGCALELNTAGWRRPVGELYPSPEILCTAFELGIPITLGSDAHEPEEAGFQLREAAQLARAAGYATITRFTGREARQVTVPSR